MLERIGTKLVGPEENRAVSPVIGVILMVAITVILAAVIAAFVLDLGGSVNEEAQAGVSLDVDETENGNITIEVTSLGNADHVELGGDILDGDEPAAGPSEPVNELELGVGDVVRLKIHTGDPGGIDNTAESGTITAIAVIEEHDTQTQVGSIDYEDFEDNNL